MLCTRCDTHNEAGANFCRICGLTLDPQAYHPSNAVTLGSAGPVYTYSNTQMQGPGCGRCGRANPTGAKFCVYCASALNAHVAPTPAIALQPVYVNVAVPAMVVPQPIVLNYANSGNLVLRAIWFLLIGWWLGLIWTVGAWLFNLTLIGLPVGLMMLHGIPTIMTLKSRNSQRVHVTANGNVVVQRPVEHPFPLRAIWFLLIGWWASLVWMIVAWSFSASLILTPIAFWMFNRVPTITTLAAEQP